MLLTAVSIGIVILLVLLVLPSKTPETTPLALPRLNISRSMRDIEVDEDLAAIGDAYRESERIARQKAAIAKVTALHVEEE